MDPFLVHAVLMSIAWFILLPAGVLIARFFKVTKNQDWPHELDNQLWWHSHRWLNYAGIGLATLGMLIMWQTIGGPALQGWHGRIGLATMALGWLQIISAWLRGSKGGPTDPSADPNDPTTWQGDHFDMTVRRRLFEIWHKQLGYVVLFLALIAAWQGLESIAAPLWIKALPWSAASIFLILFHHFTHQGRRFDTHAAIFGSKPKPNCHPAKRKKREVS